jgi:hypothetical protein
MGFCPDSTPEMGEYSVEVRRESFYLRGASTYNVRPQRHAIHIYDDGQGQGTVEILTEDIPKIRAALDLVEKIARK